MRCAATMTRQIASDCTQRLRWCVADDALLCSSRPLSVHTPSTLQGGTKLSAQRHVLRSYRLHPLCAIPSPLLQTLCERAAQHLPRSARTTFSSKTALLRSAWIQARPLTEARSNNSHH